VLVLTGALFVESLGFEKRPKIPAEGEVEASWSNVCALEFCALTMLLLLAVPGFVTPPPPPPAGRVPLDV
jgi:hypothetical protein